MSKTFRSRMDLASLMYSACAQTRGIAEPAGDRYEGLAWECHPRPRPVLELVLQGWLELRSHVRAVQLPQHFLWLFHSGRVHPPKEAILFRHRSRRMANRRHVRRSRLSCTYAIPDLSWSLSEESNLSL